MKRIFVLLLAFLLCACSVAPSVSVDTDGLPTADDTAAQLTEPPVTTVLVTEAPITEPPVTEPPEPELPELCFFLDDLSGSFEIISSEFVASCVAGKDVGCFGIIPSVEVEGKKSYRAFWNEAYNLYPELDGLKIGYELDFRAGGKDYSIDISSPDDTVGDFNEYLEVYIYDDVNQIEGQFYSHLLEWQMNENTLITSIKLTGGPSADKVEGINLYVHLYDASGNRLCINSLTIVLK